MNLEQRTLECIRSSCFLCVLTPPLLQLAPRLLVTPSGAPGSLLIPILFFPQRVRLGW